MAAGSMKARLTDLPTGGPMLTALEEWMHGAGGTRLEPTSEWEVTRWRFGKATLILYRNAQEQRRWTCNDYGILSTVEKAMRGERVQEAPPVAAPSAARQRPERTRAARSGPSGAMDVIDPADHHDMSDHPVTPAQMPAPQSGVTAFKTGKHGARIELKRLLCERQLWRCFYCDGSMAMTQTPCNHQATFEHLVPKSTGGPDVAANLVIACLKCNNAVGAMSVYEKMIFRDRLRAELATTTRAPGALQPTTNAQQETEQ